MYTLHVLVIFLLWGMGSSSDSSVTPKQHTLIEQLNAYEMHDRYDTSNRVFCQKYTDFVGNPILTAIDDFVLPKIAPGEQCQSLSFDLNVIMTRRDRGPDALTLSLYYHNETDNAPCEEPFFVRHFVDSKYWVSKALSRPVLLRLELTNGDANDSGRDFGVRFDLGNETLLPRHKRLWVGFYATLPNNYDELGLSTNNMMWTTLNHKRDSSPLLANHLGLTHLTNMNYRYRDFNNFLSQDFTRWVDAEKIQPIMGIHTATFNLAWRLTLECTIASKADL